MDSTPFCRSLQFSFFCLALTAAAWAGEKQVPSVLTLVLPDHMAAVLPDEDVWLDIAYYFDPNAEPLFHEPAEKVWRIDGQKILFLGSSGYSLPAAVLDRATIHVRISHSQLIFDEDLLTLHPRRSRLPVGSDARHLSQTLGKAAGGIDAAYLAELANYLVGNVASVEVFATSFNVAGIGEVINDQGQWVGDPTGLQGPPGDPGDPGASPFTLEGDDAVFTQGKLGLGTTSPAEALDVVGTVKASRFVGDGSALTGIGAPTSVAHPEYFRPAFLTGGTDPEANPVQWSFLASGRFSITLDGTAYDVEAGFSGVSTMADVAGRVQLAIRSVTGGLETVSWQGNHFLFTSEDHGDTSTISVLSTHSSGLGLDISGAGSDNWLDADLGAGFVTLALLDVTHYQGQVPILGPTGTLDPHFVKQYKSLGPDANTLDFLLSPLESTRSQTGGSATITRFRMAITAPGSREAYFWGPWNTLSPNSQEIVFEAKVYLYGGNLSGDKAALAIGQNTYPLVLHYGLDSGSYREVGILTESTALWTAYAKNGSAPASRVTFPAASNQQLRIVKQGTLIHFFVNGIFVAELTTQIPQTNLYYLNLAAQSSSTGSVSAGIHGDILLRFSTN